MLKEGHSKHAERGAQCNCTANKQHRSESSGLNIQVLGKAPKHLRLSVDHLVPPFAGVTTAHRDQESQKSTYIYSCIMLFSFCMRGCVRPQKSGRDDVKTIAVNVLKRGGKLRTSPSGQRVRW